MNPVLNHAIYRIQKIAQQVAAPGAGMFGNPLTTGAMALGAMSGDSMAERGVGAGAGYLLANAVQQYMGMNPQQRAAFLQNNPQLGQQVQQAAAQPQPITGQTVRQRRAQRQQQQQRGANGQPQQQQPQPQGRGGGAGGPGHAGNGGPGAAPAPAPAPGGAAQQAAPAVRSTGAPQGPQQISLADESYRLHENARAVKPGMIARARGALGMVDPSSATANKLTEYQNRSQEARAFDRANNQNTGAKMTGGRIAGTAAGAVGGAMAGRALGDLVGHEDAGTVLGALGGGLAGNKLLGNPLAKSLSRVGAGTGVSTTGNAITNGRSPFTRSLGRGALAIGGLGLAGYLGNKLLGGRSKKKAADPEAGRMNQDEFDTIASVAGYERTPNRDSSTGSRPPWPTSK